MGLQFIATTRGTVVDRTIDGYQPYASQRAFHLNRSRFKGYSGPVGTGKTKALCYEALQQAYLNSGCMGVLAAPTYRLLQSVTKLTFVEILEENRIPYHEDKTDKYVLLKECGSRVLFRSTEEPARLVGMNLAWFGIDELTYANEDAWRRLIARIRDPKATWRCGFAAWTPKGHDWVWRKFIKREANQDGIDGGRYYSCTIARPAENRAVLEADPEYYERLRHSYDEKFYRQEVLGEYLNLASGQVYHAFDRMVNVQPREFDPSLPLCWALDFNVNPMASVLAQVRTVIDPYTFERIPEITVLEEIILNNAYTTDACQQFYERSRRYVAKQRPLNVLLYGDASGGSRTTSSQSSDWQIVESFLQQYPALYRVSKRVPTSNPLVKNRVNAVNGLLRSAFGETRLWVHPICAELLMDFEEVLWSTTSTGRMLPEIDKDRDLRRTHVSDALGYLVWEESPLQRIGGYRA